MPVLVVRGGGGVSAIEFAFVDDLDDECIGRINIALWSIGLKGVKWGRRDDEVILWLICAPFGDETRTSFLTKFVVARQLLKGAGFENKRKYRSVSVRVRTGEDPMFSLDPPSRGVPHV